MLNMPLKSVTSMDTYSGFKIDLSAQLSQFFQLGGSWQYNKTASTFSLNTAVSGSVNSQEANFVAGTYHNDGKLEARNMFKLSNDLKLSGEILFPSAAIERAYYALELNKQLSDCTLGFKSGTGMKSFTYMQMVSPNCFAGFECAYLVPASLEVLEQT
jgi:hypothetical protein